MQFLAGERDAAPQPQKNIIERQSQQSTIQLQSRALILRMESAQAEEIKGKKGKETSASAQEIGSEANSHATAHRTCGLNEVHRLTVLPDDGHITLSQQIAQIDHTLHMSGKETHGRYGLAKE